MIIKASEIKAGTKLAESDGYLFNVEEVVKETEKTITVRLCSDFSPCQNLWTIKKNVEKGGIIKTFRKSTRIYGVA